MMDKQKLEEELIRMRRELHRIPEFDMELPETAAYIKGKLDELEIPYRTAAGGSGVIADIRGGKPGKTVLIRADIDALHVTEETGRSYASEHPGLMHACGHDAHAAILLTAARIFMEKREQLAGTVRLVFQPGEETGNGAPAMIRDGALQDADYALALHVGSLAGSDYEPGCVIIAPGAVSSGFDQFKIRIRGTATHGAYPEKGVDPIAAAAHLITAYEELSFRELAAGTRAVIDIGSIHAGTDPNTIPGEAVLTGCLRSQSEEVRTFVLSRMAEIGENLTKAFRAGFEFETKRNAFPVLNDPALAEGAFQAVQKQLGANVRNTGKGSFMAADDFGEYSSRVPSLYFFLHTNDPEKGIDAPNHSPYFDLDESCLMRGAEAMITVTEELLK